MKCKKCGSDNLDVVVSGPHNKLVCKDCLAFQKFLSTEDAKTFEQLKEKEDNKPRGFMISKEEYLEVSEWLVNHDKSCKFADPHKCGAIGGRLTYCFTGTSLGEIGKVLCACGEEFVFTDCSDW